MGYAASTFCKLGRIAAGTAAIPASGVLIFFVRNRTPAPGPRYRPHVALRAALGLLREPRVRAMMVAAVLLALFTMGDAFVYLTFQHTTDFTTSFFPLLYVGTALIYLLLAVPMGRLADRIGRGRVFLAGQLFLVGAYALLLLEDPGPAALVAILAMLGTYYAATDGVLMALAGAILPQDLRTSGIALLTTGGAANRELAP